MAKTRGSSYERSMEMASRPLRNNPNAYSRESVGRFSEHSLHSAYTSTPGFRDGSTWDSCMTRIPYATLIATIICVIGVGIFCVSINRGLSLSFLLFDEVFNLRLLWLEHVKILLVIMAASMAAMGVMIVFVGCLATGATRHKVYRAWRARVGGRISCAVFMVITYIMFFVWIALKVALSIVVVIYSIFWQLCSSTRISEEQQCIDLRQFDFSFPERVRHQDLMICEANKKKLFCKDYVEKAEVMFILATFAVFLIVLSLVHYLMCLSANYAHIRDQEKFQELQELQYLADPEGLTSSKDRF
ncbi:proteolipid protein DM beta isoform X1 [Nilaparvata lugens]|uniref:proteolipid protein DM beta isoform X1 n=1 Tax=Nilaparvata lugens TaxID=108931 RepID=UPI00193D0B56|nr:proteolipid protein DM beta isoform X1 [Nilaparvata lugens]XP_039279772.1 proteolipid protein DM beta isoform X1 [Nilaparvata lugens]